MGSYGPFWDGPTVPLEVESATDPPPRLSHAWLLAGGGLAAALLLAGGTLAAVNAIGPPLSDPAIGVAAPTGPPDSVPAPSPAGPAPDTPPTTALPSSSPRPAPPAGRPPPGSPPPPAGSPPVFVSSPPARPSPSRGPGKTCGAPANPWGFNLCGRGGPIHRADLPARVCDYFACTHNFRAGKGYMVECRDGEYSMTGGLSGACAGHGGEHRRVRAG